MFLINKYVLFDVNSLRVLQHTPNKKSFMEVIVIFNGISFLGSNDDTIILELGVVEVYIGCCVYLLN